MKTIVAAAALAGALAVAGDAAAQFEPDVPYVTTPWNVVETILEMAQVSATDHLIDLGSGDGRIVIAAAKQRGASGTGIELVQNLVRTAQDEARRQGVAGRATFVEGSLFEFDLRRASVLTMYLFPQINIRLRPRLFEQLKPGTRVVSHDFHMDEWQPDAQREVAVPGKAYGPPRSMVYLWVMPVNAAGKWRWQLPVNNIPVAFEATIGQRFQKLAIIATAGGEPAFVTNMQLRGDQLRFTLTRDWAGRPVTHELSGRVDGDGVSGTARSGPGADASVEWKATRVERGTMRIE
jgi:hypothetical protein